MGHTLFGKLGRAVAWISLIPSLNNSFAQTFIQSHTDGVYSSGIGYAMGDFTRDGAPDLFTTGPLGFNLIFGLNLNSQELKYGNLGWTGTPAYPAGGVAFVIAAEKARMNNDKYDDLVISTNAGYAGILINAGSHQINGQSFLPAQQVDFFGPSFTANPPFINLRFNHVQVIDINNDGNKDIVVAGAPVDVWTASTLPGAVNVYLGSASGSYTKYSIPTPGSVVDIQWAALDAAAPQNRLIYLTETGSAGAFSSEIYHAKFDTATNTLALVGGGQNIPGRFTSLKMANVLDLTHTYTDYIMTSSDWTGAGGSKVFIYEGDGLGNIQTTAWNYLQGIPASTSTLNEAVYAGQAVDFNNDSFMDYAFIRTHAAPAPYGSGTSAQFDNTEVFVVFGPNIQWASPEQYVINGFVSDDMGSLSQAWARPQNPNPKQLGLWDMSGNGIMDLIVPMTYRTGGTTTNPTNIPSLNAFKNQTPAAPGSPELATAGEPSGIPASAPILQGLEGDLVEGSTNFGITMQGTDLKGGEFWGIAYSPYSFPSWGQNFGIDLHIVPAQDAYVIPGLLSGNGTPGSGFGILPVNIPSGLAGTSIYFQSVVFSPYTGRFRGSEATMFTVGQ